jgi:hypothetical protein
MRSAVLEEAARILRLPVQALYDDYDKMSSKALKPAVKGNATLSQEKKNDDKDTIEVILEGQDASSPEVLPLPTAEMELCKLLAGNEKNRELYEILLRHTPDELFLHPFTVRFLKAWLNDLLDEGVSLKAFPGECTIKEGQWLDEILMSESMSFSELSPVRILQDLLRRLWMDALERRQKTLPGISSPENDAKRLNLSILMRRIQRAKWAEASLLMSPGNLIKE